MAKLRIAIGKIWQEQNIFSPKRTGISDFNRAGLYYGEELIKRFEDINEIGGFINTANKEKDIELLPTIRAVAWPSGKILNSTYNKIKKYLIESLKKNLPLDGVLLLLHGSMVTEDIFDTEGDILETIKKEISKDIPIAISLDLHANITDKMINNTIFIEGYNTSPHIDLLRTGKKVAGVFIDFLKRKKKLNVGFVKLPMITPTRLHNTEKGPLKVLVDYISNIEYKSDLISVSLFAVQPWLDIPDVGWSVIVYTDSNQAQAQNYANRIAEVAWNLKDDFIPDEISIDSALSEAIKMGRGLIVISDSDSTTAGTPGDNTYVLEELLNHKIKLPVLLCMIDKSCVKKAIKAGIGNRVNGEVGGKFDNIFCGPVKINAIVENITDGKMTFDGCGGKNYFDLGKIAVLKVDNITIAVCEETGLIHERAGYEKAGLNPQNFRLVLVKSRFGFMQTYKEIADSIEFLDCPGLSPANLNNLDYKNTTRPLYPFDNIKKWGSVKR